MVRRVRKEGVTEVVLSIENGGELVRTTDYPRDGLASSRLAGPESLLDSAGRTACAAGRYGSNIVAVSGGTSNGLTIACHWLRWCPWGPAHLRPSNVPRKNTGKAGGTYGEEPVTGATRPECGWGRCHEPGPGGKARSSNLPPTVHLPSRPARRQHGQRKNHPRRWSTPAGRI